MAARSGSATGKGKKKVSNAAERLTQKAKITRLAHDKAARMQFVSEKMAKAAIGMKKATTVKELKKQEESLALCEATCKDIKKMKVSPG